MNERLTWLGIAARLSGAWHWVRGHRLSWRVRADELCSGDIVCYRCPDTSDGVSDLAIWCRGAEAYG